MTQPSQERLLEALSTVHDPDLKKDLVTLGMIRDLAVAGDGTVSLRVVLTTPACPLKKKIEDDVRAALTRVPGVTGVNVKMDAEVRAKAAGPAQMASIAGVAHIIA